ncbi:hypothetical protein RchiOBHm_CPg0501891 (chloroplast) [Rosa chinensis]|uniref:Uncharacterized protein n=1 Tax=Rosa chinensis TaxID=74649 RepID=A0A2P6P180_ROSCH|nr:hypothetical protein RchiOBHm_CPg0501891 [Rosa chinensis]
MDISISCQNRSWFFLLIFFTDFLYICTSGPFDFGSPFWFKKIILVFVYVSGWNKLL